MNALSLFVLLTVAIILVQGLPSGPPVTSIEQRTAVCKNLIPAATSPHRLYIGHNSYAVSTDLPLNSTVNMYQYTAGAQYTVTINGNTFKGFLMQAMSPSYDVIGTFQPGDSTQQLLDCSGAGIGVMATITHSNLNKMDFTEQTFRWSAPSGGNGYMTFKYTLVPLADRYFGPLTAPPPPPAAPTRAVGDYPLTQRYPAGCQPSDNCSVFIGVATNHVNSGFLDIYMEAMAVSWVSSGFSPTNNMFIADVVTCIYDVDTTMVVGLNTINDENERLNTIRMETQQTVVFFNGTRENGFIKCTLGKSLRANSGPFAYVDQEYWMLYAQGAVGTVMGLSYHGLGPENRGILPQKINPVLAARSTAVAAPSTMSPSTAVSPASAGTVVSASAPLLSIIITSITLFLKL